MAGLAVFAASGCTGGVPYSHSATLADTALSSSTTSSSSSSSGSGSGSSGSSSGGAVGPAIVSAVAGPASGTNYFDLTTTYIVTGSDLSPNGDNTVVSNCPGGGLNTNDTPKAVEKLSDVPATDGSGNVVLTLEFAIPTALTNCTVTVTRPDGVSAPSTTITPYWLGDPSFTYVLTNTSGSTHAIPQGGTSTLEITGAPDSAPVWLGWYNSPSASAGGQSKFTQVAEDSTPVTSATGTLNYTFGGPSDVRTDMGGGYYLVIVIEHQLERIYWPG